MGLQRDIERVIEETAGASIPGGFSKDQKSMVKKFSRGITNSIVRWLLDQEFTITEMKSILEDMKEQDNERFLKEYIEEINNNPK